jgi:hypothetical protein
MTMFLQASESHSDLCDGQATQGGPGIMVLSSQLQPLHINRRAVTLLSDLVSAIPEAQMPNSRAATLPPPLVDLAGKILGVLRRRGESAEKGQCEICYLADNASKQVVIRCIGLPSRNGPEGARIVFVLTDTNGSHVNDNSTPIRPS